MAIVLDPALGAMVAGPPLNQCGFADPGFMVVLDDAPVFRIVHRVERFGTRFGKKIYVWIRQRSDCGFGGKSLLQSFQRIASRTMGENGVQKISLRRMQQFVSCCVFSIVEMRSHRALPGAGRKDHK